MENSTSDAFYLDIYSLFSWQLHLVKAIDNTKHLQICYASVTLEYQLIIVNNLYSLFPVLIRIFNQAGVKVSFIIRNFLHYPLWQKQQLVFVF